MSKIPLRIEVVRSNITAYSSMGLKSATAIAHSLRRQYEQVIVTNVDNEYDLAMLIARQPDLVFLGMVFVRSENEPHAKIWVSEMLEKNSITHTGSNTSAHPLGLNKHLAKQRIIESGLQTSPFQIIARNSEVIINNEALIYPLFVKPTNKGGGQGIDEFSVVRTIEQLRTKVASIHTAQTTDALVERFLTGREFSIAIIGNPDSRELTAMPIELVVVKDINGERILSKVMKSQNVTDVRKIVDAAELMRIQTFAINIFQVLGARDYGRIDIRMDEFGTPHFLEVNLIPSLIENYGSFPKAYELNLGRSYETMLMQIVQLALARKLTPAHLQIA